VIEIIVIIRPAEQVEGKWKHKKDRKEIAVKTFKNAINSVILHKDATCIS